MGLCEGPRSPEGGTAGSPGDTQRPHFCALRDAGISTPGPGTASLAILHSGSENTPDSLHQTAAPGRPAEDVTELVTFLSTYRRQSPTTLM